MKLSEFKNRLDEITEVNFIQPNGEKVPPHFHVTEVGKINKHFIDCGGTVRNENVVNFQLWEAGDYDHRIGVQKLKDIIKLSENALGIEDNEIEVEYQVGTIGKYAVGFDGENFVLENKQTTCLASDKCGTPVQKEKVNLSELQSKKESCCTPGGGCC